MLALALGLTVRELLARITSPELSEWAAFYERQPFGEWRSDFRAAMIAHTTASVWRGKKKGPSFKDFMPDFRPKQPVEAQDPQVMARALRSWAIALGGTIERESVRA